MSEFYDAYTGEALTRPRLRSARRRNGGDYTFHCSGPSKTRQDMAEECDINKIMERYQKTGVLPFPPREAVYLDVSEVPDLQGALEFASLAEEAFMRIPAVARARFDNDPVRFVRYAEDPENLGQMREWGLAPPAPVEAPPIKVEVSNPAAAAPAA